jgi:hypothetical protein
MKTYNSIKPKPIANYNDRTSKKLVVAVGDKHYPIADGRDITAHRYDHDRDGVVTLDDITQRLDSYSGGPLTKDSGDNAVTIRQHLAGLPSPHLDFYPDNSQIENNLAKLAEQFPDKAEVVTVGASNDGRAIKGLRISENLHSEETTSKSTVLVTGNLHAREWATNMAVSAAAQKILNGAVGVALPDLEILLVPNGNPDGYEYSRVVDPHWRKNTAIDESGKIVGVDLNRNCDHQFRFEGDLPDRYHDDEGGSDNPNSFTYRGKVAFSEPESRMVRDLIDQAANPIGYLDVHSCGRAILLPDGNNGTSWETYKEIGDSMNAVMEDADYNVINDYDLYKATGTTSRYADSKGLTAITLEIGTSRQPPPEKAVGVVDRASDAIVEFVRQAHRRQ